MKRNKIEREQYNLAIAREKREREKEDKELGLKYN